MQMRIFVSIISEEARAKWKIVSAKYKVATEKLKIR